MTKLSELSNERDPLLSGDLFYVAVSGNSTDFYTTPEAIKDYVLAALPADTFNGIPAVVVSGAGTLAENTITIINATSSFTLTLPDSADDTIIGLADIGETLETYDVSISPALGTTISGVSGSLVLDQPGAMISFVKRGSVWYPWSRYAPIEVTAGGSIPALAITATEFPEPAQVSAELATFAARISNDQAIEIELPDNTGSVRVSLLLIGENPTEFHHQLATLLVVFKEAYPDNAGWGSALVDLQQNSAGDIPAGFTIELLSPTVNRALTAGEGNADTLTVNAWRNGIAAYLGLSNRAGYPMQVSAQLTVMSEVEDTSPTDPEFSNVSLLLPLDGANGSTTFTDASSNGFTVTRLGSSVISTAQSVFGGAALYLPNTSPSTAGTDGLQVADNAAFEFGTGDFTVEAWVYLTNASATTTIATNYGGATTGWSFQIDPSRRLYFNLTGDGIDVQSATTIALNTWIYVAAKRNGSTVTLHQGTSGSTTQVASATNSVSIAGSNLTIGGLFVSGFGWFNHFRGYVDDLRITKGVARDVSVVPVAAFPTS
jgi:hypothetical protein